MAMRQHGKAAMQASGDAPLVMEFVRESFEHLDRAQGALMKLEQDPLDLEQIHALFRSFHTIKGVAGSLNLDQVAALAHGAEDLLAAARDGKVAMEGGVINRVRCSLGRARTMIAGIELAARDYCGEMQPALTAPIEALLEKTARRARDLASKAGKEIEVVIAAGQIELGRGAARAMSEVLMHLVRNSIDHGIEPPEQRVNANKARAGRIELAAQREGSTIVLQVVDDGRGIDTGRALQKAIELGLVKGGERLSEGEILRLVLCAGLSTAGKVTEMSGRGVGLDVVRRNVEALGGSIEIASSAGKGAAFIVRLPQYTSGCDDRTHQRIVDRTI